MRLYADSVQAKLHIGAPNDPYEQEADHVADTVMRMSEEKKTKVRTKPIANQVTPLVRRILKEVVEEEPIVQQLPGIEPKQEEEIAQAKLGTAYSPDIHRQVAEDQKKEIVQTKRIIQGQPEEEEKIQAKQFSNNLTRQVPNTIPDTNNALGTGIQRLCTECKEEMQRQPEEEEELAQTKPLVNQQFVTREPSIQAKDGHRQTPRVSSATAAKIHSLNGGGSQLPRSALSFFEPRFGADFSQVRVHTDTRAAESAKSINARAFTMGRNIAFGANQYSPGSHKGRQLLAHELTHVVQQNGRSQQLTHPMATSQMLQRTISSDSNAEINNTRDVIPIFQGSSIASSKLHVFQTSCETVSRNGGDEDASVTAIIDALDGITTAGDSAIILSQFQNQGADRLRAILRGLKAKAPEHGVTGEGMIDWLFSDMTAEDGAALRQILIRSGVHAEINRIIVDELYSLLSGYTSEADSQEIHALLVQYTGGGLDQLLSDLATRAEMSGDALGEWLLDDLDRVNAERVRVHFLTFGADNAVNYAAEFTAAKIESLLSGYTGHADSSSILRNFRDTPENRRPIVQAKLEAKTQTSWGQSAEDALMEDMDREDYEAVRVLGGITLREYDYTPTWYEKIISVAEWGLIVAQWLSCGILGIVTGVIAVIWDIIKILADVVVGVWHLLWSLVYLMTGGTFGSENWLKVKQFFSGIGAVLGDPGTVWDQYWATVGLEYNTIEGPLTDCRRAEFVVRKFIKVVLNIALIFLAGYGIAKGIASAIKTVQAVARLRLLAGGVRNALRLVRLGGNSVDDVARLETLLASRKVASVGELETLLGHSKVASAIKLESILSNAKLTSAAELQELLNSAKVTSAAEIQAILNNSKLATVAELQTLLSRTKVTSLAEIQSLLSHSKVASAAELDALLGNAKLSSIAELNGLLNDTKVASAAQLQRVLGGMTDVAELNRLLALVDDAAQLERFQAAIGNSAEVERLIRTAGLGNPPVADAFRLDRVLSQMGPGRQSIQAIESELAALKRLDSKILRGEPRAPTPPGMAPVGQMQRGIRGVHSASIINDTTNFQVVVLANNADGTIWVKLKKLLYTDPSGTQTWSTWKRSTLAPASWAERDILAAGDRVAAMPPISGPRTWGSADGAFMHRGMVNGVQWEVIKDATGRVISSYPTGGTPAPTQF